MALLKRAAVYGLIAGVWIVAAVYLAVRFLPPVMSLIIPIGLLGIPIAFLWPRWFDVPAGTWRTRLLRRLGFLAAAVPVGALAAFLIVAAWPGYIEWGDRLHRENLQKQGKSPEEIEATVAAHHQEPVHFLSDGAFAAGAPGVIATLVTTAAGAVMFRKRPSRP